MTQDRTPTPELRALVASALGKEPVRWLAPHTGLSAAQRFVVRFADGSSAFVKAAVDDPTEEWLPIGTTKGLLPRRLTERPNSDVHGAGP